MTKVRLLLLVLFSLSLNACSSDDSSTPNPTPPIVEDPQTAPLHIKFKLNSEEFSFEPYTLTTLQRHIIGEENINDMYHRISIWTPVTPTVGGHEVSDATPTDANLDTLYSITFYVDDRTYTANQGTISITEVSNQFIKGTFICTGTDDTGAPFTITDGSFKADR